jgi:hypothetical protein
MLFSNSLGRVTLKPRMWLNEQRARGEQTPVRRCLHFRMLKSLAIDLLLLVVRCAGQDWRTVGTIPTLRYPCLALMIKWQGPVVIRFTLDGKGTPEHLKLVRGHPFLVKDAGLHLKSLVLRPVGNTPRDQVRTVRYVFQLDPALKYGTDIVPVRFELPNIFLVSAGFVKPSSPCPVPSSSDVIKKDSLFEP